MNLRDTFVRVITKWDQRQRNPGGSKDTGRPQ
jgi:hypothetical protein